LLPEFFRRYPEIAVDLHLTDAQTDLIGEGYDAALRIAVLADSSLVARLITPVRRFLVASPAYIASQGAPQHPRELASHRCASYANRAKRDVWRFVHQETGEETSVTPAGPLRGTSAEALLPTVLAGLAITELPEFIATQYFPDGQLEPLLPAWRQPEGGLYFVTPTARARPAKVSALADFLIAALTDAPWSAEGSDGLETAATALVAKGHCERKPCRHRWREHGASLDNGGPCAVGAKVEIAILAVRSGCHRHDHPKANSRYRCFLAPLSFARSVSFPPTS
jgi:hypothetical protein